MALLLWFEMVRYQCTLRLLDVRVTRSCYEKIETYALLYLVLYITYATY